MTEDLTKNGDDADVGMLDQKGLMVKQIREDKDGNIINRSILGQENMYRFQKIREEENQRRLVEQKARAALSPVRRKKVIGVTRLGKIRRTVAYGKKGPKFQSEEEKRVLDETYDSKSTMRTNLAKYFLQMVEDK